MGGVINPGGGGGGGGGDVTAAANITDNAIVRGDGGAKGIQSSGVLIDDSDNVTGMTTAGLSVSGDTGAVNLRAPSGLGSASYILDFPTSEGTSGQVLTTNGGLGTVSSSWTTIAGGFADWKTIGTGGDYADVQAMIDGGDTKGVLLSDVTEDSNIAVPAGGLSLHLNDFTLTMAAFQFTWAAEAPIFVEGFGNTSQIDYTQTSANEECFDTSTFTGSIVTLKNFLFDNNSSASGTHLAKADSILNASGLLIENPNVSDVGVEIQNNLSYIKDSTWTSAGTTNTNALELTIGKAENVIFNGNFNTVSAVNMGSPDAILEGAVFNGNLGIKARGWINNVTQPAGTGTWDVDTSNTYISNSRLITFTSYGFDGVHLVNCRVNTWTQTASADDTHLLGCYFSSACSVVGQNTIIDNCYFANNLTINSGADDTQISNTRVAGTFASTGIADQLSNCRVTGTFTVNAGADNGQYNNMYWDGNVSVTSDTARYSGYVNTANTFTLNATATNNKVDVTIDQAVTDNGTTNIVTELVY